MSAYVLDPGHGNGDRGACQNGIIESEYAYHLCEVASAILRERGHRVVLTHEPNEDPNQHARAKVAMIERAVGTISVHVNAGAMGEHGPLTFYQLHDVAGWRAAHLMIQKLNRGGVYSVGVNTPVVPMRYQVHVVRSEGWTSRAWACLNPHVLPAVLFETEYCSHAPSARWLQESVRDLAEVIADGCEALG
jgi:N-acetylmuramoyl-L-alanine amidase